MAQIFFFVKMDIKSVVGECNWDMNRFQGQRPQISKV